MMLRVPRVLIQRPNSGAKMVAATTPGNNKSAASAAEISSENTSRAGRNRLPDCNALVPAEIRQLLVICFE